MNMKKCGNWIKRNIGQIVMLVFYMAMGFGCGMIAAQATDAAGGGFVQMLLLLFAGVYLSMLIHIILHEAGHMVFGLMTGYKFVSFRIGSFVLQRTREGKYTFGHSPLSGAAGQCLMSPPELKNGKIPFALYNLGGVIMNGVVSLIALAAATACEAPAAAALLKICALVGLILGAMNGIPLRLGAADNDGYNILSMKKSDAAIRSLWVQLKIAEQNAWGVRLKDMPEEWFAMPPRTEMKNSLCAALAVFHCSRLMDELKFGEARTAMKNVLRMKHGMVGLHAASMKIDMVCCALMVGEKKEAEGILNNVQVKKIMKAMKTNICVLRTQYADALLGEGDADKAEKILAQFESMAKTWPSAADVEGEREIIACIQKKFFA
ncbi:MAG: hypothetical protein IJE08_06120 [Clostridia bacterium]|nr:hypothetical protein [Clostridia bacterium]